MFTSLGGGSYDDNQNDNSWWKAKVENANYLINKITFDIGDIKLHHGRAIK